MAETFGQLLRRFRVRAGLNVSELAEAVGADRKSIAAWERDRYAPRDRARLIDLVQVLRLAPAEADQLRIARRQQRSPSTIEMPAPIDDQPDASGHSATRPALALCHQLCPPISDFVGRAAELEQLVGVFRTAIDAGSGAIISGLQGMGGIGKTQLAYAVAHRLHDVFPDAQIVLDLRGSQAIALTAEQALQAAIRAFVRDEKLPDDRLALEQYYRSVLYNRRVLILADDARDADQVRGLIPPRHCALLVTSRQRFTLPGMVMTQLEQLSEEEAITFLRIICCRLNTDEARAIAHACGYLPLALRVSGSILHNNPPLPITAYVQQLRDARQRLWSLRDPDDPQLNVEACLSLSYAQLDPAAQSVFRQLGVIVGHFATDLVQAVVEADTNVAIEGILHGLLRRNMIMYDPARARWRLHDLVRALAWRYLVALGEAEAAAWRYAQAGVQLAQAIDALYLAGGDRLLAALVRFDVERPHIDAARRWAAQRAGASAADTLLLADLVAICNIAHLRYGVQHEQLPQLEQALAAARRLGDRQSEGTVLHRLAVAYALLGDIQQSIAYAEQELTIAQALGDRRGEACAFDNLGCAYTDLGDPACAIPYHEQELTIAQALGDRRGEARAFNNLGYAYGKLGDALRAIPYFEQALEVAQALGEWHGQSNILCDLGECYVALGEPQRAIACCRRVLTITQDLRNQRCEGYAWIVLGCAYTALGDLAQGFCAFEQALGIFAMIGDRLGEAQCNWHFGLALACQGDHEGALPLLRACLAYEQEVRHTKATEHAALLGRIEAGVAIPQKPSRGDAGQAAIAPACEVNAYAR